VVILDDNNMEKPDIEYPTQWGFKLIGRDRDALLACIKEIMGDRDHTCAIGNRSQTGKFHSYNAKCTVDTQEDRDRIFKYFQDHDDVKMVI